MSGCLEENTLFELVRGELGEALRQDAIRHADTCGACRRLIAVAIEELASDGNAGSEPEALRHELLGGKYRLERPIGSGGMGAVYEAVNTWTRRRVAIKLMHPAFAADSAAVRRFMQEAQSATRIAHPSVVEVLDLGEDSDGTPFIVQEFLTGATLRHRLNERGRLSVDETIALAVPVLSALVAAHESGVVHRDVKPENIFLTLDRDGREIPKLIDFGLSKRTLASDGLLVTEHGRPLGTPFYMSPEQVRVEPDVDERSDVWSLGVVLFEAIAGQRPFRGPAYHDLVVQILTEPVPRLISPRAPGVPAAFAMLVERALERDRERRLTARELRDALVRLTGRAAGLRLPPGNPYRGISPFDADHRGVFFGREGEIWTVIERLRDDRLVFVAGDSGVGKSSLVRAGVVPLLGDGADGDAEPADIATLTPGRRPWAALVDAVQDALGDDAPRPAVGDAAALSRALREGTSARRRILFIDQMEELFTLAAADEAAAVADALAVLLDEVRSIRVIGTIRSDFLGRLGALGRLGDRVARALYLLPPLTPQRVREAIIGPATITGVRFESPSMVDELAAACGAGTGGLPLLQFALSKLWEARDASRGMISADALASLGGVAGALAHHADGVLASLRPEHRPLAQRLLTAMVTPEGTHAHCAADEVLAASDDAVATRAVLETLVQGRLVTVADGGAAPGPVYQIAHDILLDGWDTLRGWRAQELERGAVRARLRRAAAEWHRLGKPPEALWTRRQLAETDGLDLDSLGAAERAFLLHSQRAAKRRRIVARSFAFGIPLLLALGWTSATLLEQRRVALQIAQRIEEAERAADTARGADRDSDTLRRRAFDALEAAHHDDGEAAWTEARKAEAAADAAYGVAAQRLELALALDSTRRDTRRRYADILDRRARLAERTLRLDDRDELVRRLATYDDGALQPRWQAPARLTLTSSPPGARITAQRYSESKGRRVLGDAELLGITPLIDRELAPGSYLLTLRAANLPDVRYPVLLTRGELARFDVDIGGAPPEGYVYVPRGRFLYGSADEDQLRLMFGAPPLHEVSTEGFFIARTEVTFADWIDFLRALSPEERAMRQPRTSGSQPHMPGAQVMLEDTRDGFRLVLQTSGARFRVAPGEPIRYPERSSRAEQRWERMPASGISWDDARAYTRWLDRSGRVPGARPCQLREWERAARGADDRLYPHGDRLAGDDANIDETYGRKPASFGPDEVGSHGASDSPFGVADLAGNVWELVATSDQADSAMIRGGGWYNNAFSARSNNNEPGEPSMRSPDIGFRVCASVPVRR